MTDESSEFGPRVVIATVQSASTLPFLAEVRSGAHLMLVADEVHQLGSLNNAKCLSIDAGLRLGLSATPVRYGDLEGTRKLFDYFGDVIPPKISLQDAIDAGRLVPYEYFPHAVTLSTEEADNWTRFTDRIRREIARSARGNNDSEITEKARLLLIRRSKIAKKAINKIGLAADVVSQYYQQGQRWLIYCEDGDQLGQVLRALEARDLHPVEYHSAMKGDKEATLNWFQSFGGILVSIRCLDEGVDIPSVSHAFILASSQNPRQFIQRRGRVLRKAVDKHKATIHDAIVVPVNLEDEPDQLSLLKSELVRSIQFAQMALNKSGAADLRHIALSLGIDPETDVVDGIEDEL